MDSETLPQHNVVGETHIPFDSRNENRNETRNDLQNEKYAEQCESCTLTDPWDCSGDCPFSKQFELENRLGRILENGEEHLQINSSKTEAIQHLIDIAKGISH